MSNVEDRLQKAAEETRRLAQNRRPEPLTRRQGVRPRGWLVFSAAFAAVILTFGLLPWLVTGSGNQPTNDPTPTSLAADPSTTESTMSTTTSAGDASCSTAGAPIPTARADLPEAVAATRQGIIEAASSCDVTALEDLAADGFSTSFGGGGVENLRTWEDEGTGQLGTLLHLLGMSYGTLETDDSVFYVWPSAHVHESWEAVPEDAVEELRQIHTEQELQSFEQFGAYAGWRTAIDQDGNWRYFTAGD